MDIFETLYFVIGIVNNLILTIIFVLRKLGRMVLVKRLGFCYLLLSLPAAASLILAVLSGVSVDTLIFISLYLAYLLIEFLFDYALKIDFRSNWKLLVPYLIFYYAMCYGFFVISWRTSKIFGIIMLCLTTVQIAAHILSHKKSGKKN